MPKINERFFELKRAAKLVAESGDIGEAAMKLNGVRRGLGNTLQIDLARKKRIEAWQSLVKSYKI